MGAIFLALVTFIWGSQRTCSVGTFSFSWCTVDGARVCGTTKEALATGHAIPVTGEFLPFVAITSDPTLLRWTGRDGLVRNVSFGMGMWFFWMPKWMPMVVGSFQWAPCLPL